ncbi:MAG: DNA helicase II / ATP-dependent DNA helicase PcrA, partial [Candidatus Berkelbacteria bacterium Licking1014_85]
MSRFEKLFNLLNPQQKIAVQSIEGPVMVLAGPGTGKTQVLTLRIANILARTHMNPYNILCLTFTESAATEMKERLVNIIGTAGYDVNISTF